MPCHSRRALLMMTAALPVGALPLAAQADARAPGDLGDVREATGEGTLRRGAEALPLTPGTPLREGDTAETGTDGLALLWLDEDTRLHMGPDSRIELAAFLSEVGGTIRIGGAMVFDRPDDRAPLDLTFTTAFGEIGVRGTRFFAGPSRGEFAVFVQRGTVEVRGAGVTRVLAAGEGCTMHEGAAPGEVAAWGEARITEAFALLGLTRD